MELLAGPFERAGEYWPDPAGRRPAPACPPPPLPTTAPRLPAAHPDDDRSAAAGGASPVRSAPLLLGPMARSAPNSGTGRGLVGAPACSAPDHPERRRPARRGRQPHRDRPHGVDDVVAWASTPVPRRVQHRLASSPRLRLGGGAASRPHRRGAAWRPPTASGSPPAPGCGGCSSRTFLLRENVPRERVDRAYALVAGGVRPERCCWPAPRDRHVRLRFVRHAHRSRSGCDRPTAERRGDECHAASTGLLGVPTRWRVARATVLSPAHVGARVRS